MSSSPRSIHPTDPVARVMMWPVATVFAEASLYEVAESLAADEIGALGVLEAGSFVGIVSERDVVAHLAQGANPAHVTAGDVMSTDLVTATPTESVLAAAQRMRESGVRHLPVFEEGKVAGLLSMRDVFEVLLDSAAMDEDVVVVPSGTRVVVRSE